MAPDHPIMRPGVTVSIGLDKTTKLKAVFKRYVDFCNSKTKDSDTPEINVDDLEFAFSQRLNENDTAETSALMKNDRIKVRKDRENERRMEATEKRNQRDSDRAFFQAMRHLLPDSCPARVADVILDCRGKLMDNKGRNQRLLSTTVRAHSAMIRKRCPWLMAKIQKARQEAKQKFEEEMAQKHDTPEHQASIHDATEIENDEDAEIFNAAGRAISGGSNEEKEMDPGDNAIGRAAQVDMIEDSSDDGKVNVIVVEADEDDSNHAVVPNASHQIHSRSDPDSLTVILSDHSPEAVKILLEYCYTNRVVALGHNAFVQACATRPNSKYSGPVPPYPTSSTSSSGKRWPNNGLPLITFSVALATIKLAEEAGMYRLSFMCEIAASQLVTKENVVEALTMSTRQKNISGNDLSRLRKAAMEVLLRRGRRGVSEIGRTSLFKKALDEDRAVIVPSLLQGTMEAVSHWEKAKGGAKREMRELSFKDIDREDAYKRMIERKRKSAHSMSDEEMPVESSDSDDGPFFDYVRLSHRDILRSSRKRDTSINRSSKKRSSRSRSRSRRHYTDK